MFTQSGQEAAERCCYSTCKRRRRDVLCIDSRASKCHSLCSTCSLMFHSLISWNIYM